MKRLLVIAGVVALLLVGTVAVVSAQTPRNWGGGCGGFVGANGDYDYTASPVFGSVAQALGMKSAELGAQIKADRSIAEIAAEKNVSVDKLVEIVSAPRIEMMGIAAKYGYMTDEQIKSMNEWMDARIKAGFEEKGYFPGGMMGGGMMGGQGGMLGPGGMMNGGAGGMMNGRGARFQS